MPQNIIRFNLRPHLALSVIDRMIALSPSTETSAGAAVAWGGVATAAVIISCGPPDPRGIRALGAAYDMRRKHKDWQTRQRWRIRAPDEKYILVCFPVQRQIKLTLQIVHASHFKIPAHKPAVMDRNGANSLPPNMLEDG